MADSAPDAARTWLSGRRAPAVLDNDLARLYEVPTKALVQAVNRNRSRFPPDFMFQLTAVEAQTDLVRKLNTLERRYDARFHERGRESRVMLPIV